MEGEQSQLIAANIRKARSLRDIAPEQYETPWCSFAQLLDERARLTPQQIYLIYYEDKTGARSEYSYAAFNRRVNQVANYLRDELGVKRGERIATLSYNHPDTMLIFFACWKIGAVATPQNASEDNVRIAFILQNGACRVLLVMPEYLERAEAIQANAECVRKIVSLDGAYQKRLDTQADLFIAPAANMLEDECMLVYTSGTTGAPKGVVLSQYNLFADCKAMAGWQGMTPASRMMCILPLHHMNGINVTHVLPMLVGSSVVLNRSFKANTFWQRVAAERVHIVSVVPTILQFLCEANEDISSMDLSACRHFICGAGTLAVSLVTRFEDRFGIKVMHGYGLSETTSFSCFTPLDLSPERHRYWFTHYGYPSIGVALPVNVMAIHDQDGRALNAGEKGEILMRGHNVMLGYFKRDDANLESFKHGWFRSGDEGFFELDEKGRAFYFITGRLKELINRGGVKYSPFEIEEVLLSCPGVKVGLAIAFDNDWYGEEVGAYVVKQEGVSLSEQQVLAHCRKHMPFAKAPKVAKFGTEVPVTATGKYQRLQLKSLFSDYQSEQFKDPRAL
ncbi:MAG: class I adenylate-forming enzyme family protein [Burkholderiales bacterium]